MRFYPPAAAATFWDLRIYTDIHYDNACAEGDAENNSCTDAEIADADVEDAADDDIADKNATTHVGAHPRDGRTREDRAVAATQPLDCWKATFCNKYAGLFNL